MIVYAFHKGCEKNKEEKELIPIDPESLNIKKCIYCICEKNYFGIFGELINDGKFYINNKPIKSIAQKDCILYINPNKSLIYRYDEMNGEYYLYDIFIIAKSEGGKIMSNVITQDHIEWDEYFMGLAILSSLRSKDPSRKVGACIVDPKTNTVLSLGYNYNVFPTACLDSDFPREKDALLMRDIKYPYAIHAELNAILNAHKDLQGSHLYTTLEPCKECVKAIIQAGISKIVYLEHYIDNIEVRDKMLSHANIESIKFEPAKLNHLFQLFLDQKEKLFSDGICCPYCGEIPMIHELKSDNKVAAVYVCPNCGHTYIKPVS